MRPDKTITFIDPETGTYYEVKAAKATVDAAWKLGFMPATSEAMDAATQIDEEASYHFETHPGGESENST